MTRAGAIAQIDTRLSTITDPAFVGVYRGELLAISGTPVLAFWVDRRVSKAVTLSNAGSTTTFTIRAYFRMQTSPDVRESVELGGNVSDSRLLEFVGGYVQMSGNMYRTVTVPYEVDILEEVTITP